MNSPRAGELDGVAHKHGDVSVPMSAAETRTRRASSSYAPNRRGKSLTDVVAASIRLHMRSIVYGGTDGIITIFAVVAGVSGASLPSAVLLILGVATLFADAVSMSVSDYMSSVAEADIEKRKRREREILFEMNPKSMENELVAWFREKGFPIAEAHSLAVAVGRNCEATIDILSIDGNNPDEEVSPTSSAVFTFVSFVFFGIIPLLADIIFLSLNAGAQVPVFFTTSVITALTLACLGALKAVMARGSPLRGALMMVVVGGFASFVSWVIAYAMSDEHWLKSADAPPSVLES